MSLRAPRLRSAALTPILFLAAGPTPAIAQRAPDGVRTGAETVTQSPCTSM